MNSIPMYIFVYLYFTWAVINVLVAVAKGRSTVFTFFGSLLITPLLMYLYLLAVPAVNEEKTISLAEQSQTAQPGAPAQLRQQQVRQNTNPLTARRP